MAEWQSYFDKTFVINLKKRTDRKERIIDLMKEYGIEYEFWEAIGHEKGYFGLILTMKTLFTYCLKNNIKKVLVFEDDVDFLEGADSFNSIMNKCVEGLKSLNWAQFYIGTQHSKPFTGFITPNILQVSAGYSTHAVAYDTRCMQFYLEHYIDQPIDNFFVNDFHKYNLSYCAYPLLATQITNHSDIAGEEIDWDYYISGNYREAIMNLIARN